MTATTVYAVHDGLVDVPKVVALYTNQAAARAHKANGPDEFRVSPIRVESSYAEVDGVALCRTCGHPVKLLGYDWVCCKRCRCTMAGCCPVRLP